MSSFQKELEEIRKIREAKYSIKPDIKKPEYNYELRKDTLDWIKKCNRYEVMKERMDKIEKQEYKNAISKIQLEDLEHFTSDDLGQNFMIELFKFNFNLEVISGAYDKYSNGPHVLMIKELVTKPKLQEDFLVKILQDYTKLTKNMIPIIMTTELMDSGFDSAKQLVMNLFYNDSNTPSISYEQLKLIYTKTNIDPEKFKFLVAKCSNKSAYSKCEKTFVERSNRDLIKILIHDVEKKFKCKLGIDLYN
jgi:hypothetical protein